MVLSVIVLVGYQYFFAPAPVPDNPAQNTPSQTQQETSQTGSPEVTDFTPSTTPAPAETTPAETRDFRTISLSTPLYAIAVSEHLATVTSLTLKDYKETNDEDSAQKQLVVKELVDFTGGVFALDTAEGSIRGLNDAFFSSDAQGTDLTLNEGEKNHYILLDKPGRHYRPKGPYL